MVCIFITGLIVIFSYRVLGEAAGSKAITRNGESMDASAYQKVINTTAPNYQIAGTALLLEGECGVLTSRYAVYKEL